MHEIFFEIKCSSKILLFGMFRDNPSFWYAIGADYQYEIGYEYTFVLEEIYHYPLTQFYADIIGEWKGKPPVESLPINGKSYGM